MKLIKSVRKIAEKKASNICNELDREDKRAAMKHELKMLKLQKQIDALKDQYASIEK